MYDQHYSKIDLLVLRLPFARLNDHLWTDKMFKLYISKYVYSVKQENARQVLFISKFDLIQFKLLSKSLWGKNCRHEMIITQ